MVRPYPFQRGLKALYNDNNLDRDKIQVMRICKVHDDENVTGATVEFS